MIVAFRTLTVVMYYRLRFAILASTIYVAGAFHGGYQSNPRIAARTDKT